MPDPNIVTTKVLAEKLDITVRWVNELSEKMIDGRPVCVREKRGRWKEKESIRGYIKFLREQSKSGTGPAERKILAQAKSAEIDLALKLSEVVHIDDVLDTVTLIVSNVRTALLSCPTEIATQIDDGMSRAEIKAIVDHHIREALKGLSEAPKAFVRKSSGDKKAR